MTFGGILTAVVTPFDDRGRVDEDAFADLVRHLLANGSDGVVVAGSTGEGATLTDEEKAALWQVALETAGDAPVIAGTGTNDTAHTVHLTERATELGCAGALIVTPYYNKPNERGIRAHFEAIAACSDIPLIAYNIPSRCVIDVPNELLRELAAEIGQLVAVKQANPESIAPIEGLDLLAGDDEKLAATLDAGGTGGICVASHLFGREMRRMIDEPDARAEIDAGLRDVWEAMTVATNPLPIKAALAMAGHRVGGLRLPLVEASEEEQAPIRAMLERHGLLATAA